MQKIINSVAASDAAHNIHGFSDLASVNETTVSVIERGEGIYVFDDRGNRYIDCTAGMFSTALGFGERELAEAAYRQMLKLPTYHTLFETTNPPAAALVDKLSEITSEKLSRVFLLNSGSEAIDTAIKLIWYHNNALGLTEKKRVISRRGSYHGNTIASASLTGMDKMQMGFDVPIDRFIKVSGPNRYRDMKDDEREAEYSQRLLEELENTIVSEGADTIAAMFIEPLSVAGGMQISPEGYFEGVQEILKKYNILLVVDEVISGFGRTGNMFACETFGLEPDVLIMAKGLSSGYQPISAVAMSEAFYEGVVAQASKIGMFYQAFTTSGHPTASAVALRNIQLIEERNLIEHVRSVAPIFQESLKSLEEHRLVGMAQGVGLAGSIELVVDKATRQTFKPEYASKLRPKIRRLAQKRGLIPRGMAEIQTFAPPIIIRSDEIEALFAAFRATLDDLADELISEGIINA